LRRVADDRPQIVDAGANDEVVTLPSGGEVILRRTLQQQSQQCMVRARFSGVFVPMDCDEAWLVNVR